jgi:hypothetical protein
LGGWFYFLRNFQHMVRTSDDLHWNFLHSFDQGSSGSKFLFRRNFRPPTGTSDDTLEPINICWPAPQTLTPHSFKHHRCHHLSPLKFLRGNQVSTVGFHCFGVLWILHFSEHPIPITSLSIRMGNLQGISFKILVARSLNVEGVRCFFLVDSFLVHH